MAGDLVPLAGRRRRRRLVVTFPLPSIARERLVQALGGEVELVDIKVAGGTEDVVLVPSTSRQLVGKIKSAFASATVLVVEVEDPEVGVRFGGHVQRTLDAGADGYFVAHSIDELATVVDRAMVGHEAHDAMEVAALEAPADDELSRVLDDLLRRVERADPGPP